MPDICGCKGWMGTGTNTGAGISTGWYGIGYGYGAYRGEGTIYLLLLTIMLLLLPVEVTWLIILELVRGALAYLLKYIVLRYYVILDCQGSPPLFALVL